MNLNHIWHKLDAARRSRFRRWHRWFVARSATICSDDTKIVFVIASPRSGTTWLQKALNEHPEITCGENRLFGSYFDVVDGPGASRLRVTMDQYAETLAQRTISQDLAIGSDLYAEELTAGFTQVAFELWRKYSGKSILVDKVTPYPGTADAVVDRILQFFPNASIIQLVRDGRDVVTSGVFHWLPKSVHGERESETQRQRRAHFMDRRTNDPMPRFFADDEMQTWARTWCEPIRAVNGLAADRYLRVKYEDMIADQSRALHSICQHIGAEDSDEVLNRCVKYSSFKRMSGGRRPGQMAATAHVRNGVVGDWENYFTTRDGELFDRQCGDLLCELGYESDRAWVSNLPDEVSLERKAA
jgi:hypothetical protein